MNIFYEIFLLLMTALQFLFPFAFKDSEEVPEQPTDSVIEEVVPGDHVHYGGNCLTGAVCDICGEVYAEEGEHVYIVNAKQATCTEDGYVTYRCNLCFYSYTGSVTPAKGHSYTEKIVEATCTSWGLKISTCSGCGASETIRTDAPKDHNFEYVRTIPADCSNP